MKISNRNNRDRSPHKYVMRSGFKMRQSASEGGGLVAHSRGASLGHDGGGLLDEGLDDGGLVGGGSRFVVGSSSSVNSLASSPGGRTGDGYRDACMISSIACPPQPTALISSIHHVSEIAFRRLGRHIRGGGRGRRIQEGARREEKRGWRPARSDQWVSLGPQAIHRINPGEGNYERE